MKKKYEMDMCSGSVFQKMLLFAIPLMCSSILQLLFNAADIVVVGRFAGDNALAAVGSNSSLINLLTNVFVGLSIGTNVLTAQYYGAKKEKDLKETAGNALAQIEEKKYETQLLAEGIKREHIRKYGFAFQGKTCFIGSM